MANNPLVSVIMPVYNAERTLSQSVDSVLVQTFKDFELIIVNDGSTDSTGEILNKLSDERINIISIQNSGPSAARNEGIRFAKGKYLSFIDSDDLWTKDKLEKQYTKLRNQPECDVVYSWTIFIDENGRYIHPLKPVRYQGNVYEKMLINNFVGSGSNILVTRRSIESSGYFNPDLKYGEEWELLIRLSKNYKFTVVDEYQIFYRQNPNSLSSSVTDMEKDSLKVIDFAYSNAPDEFLKLKSKSIACLNSYLSYLYLSRRNCVQWNKHAIYTYIKAVKTHPAMLLSINGVLKLIYLLIISVLPEKYAKNITENILKYLGIFYSKIYK